MNLRRFFLCAATALFLTLAIITPTFAQDPNRLSSLKISLWPEYDRPTVLVILNGTLADKGNLPRDVSVVVPTLADVVVTTYVNTDGRQAPEQVFKTADLNDGTKRITFSIATAEYWVEYYDDLVRGAPDKTIAFALKSPSAADLVSFEIQQPVRASNLTSTPSSQLMRTEPDGLSYYGLQLANIAAGQAINAQIKYTRTETRLSRDLITPAATNSAPIGTLEQPGASQNIFFAVAAVVLGIAAAIGFFVLRQRNTRPALVRQPSRRAQANPRRERAANPKTSAFCPQCGRALSTEDNFCPRCGTKRRAT
jgi:hypothetical protein